MKDKKQILYVCILAKLALFVAPTTMAMDMAMEWQPGAPSEVAQATKTGVPYLETAASAQSAHEGSEPRCYVCEQRSPGEDVNLWRTCSDCGKDAHRHCMEWRRSDLREYLDLCDRCAIRYRCHVCLNTVRSDRGPLSNTEECPICKRLVHSVCIPGKNCVNRRNPSTEATACLTCALVEQWRKLPAVDAKETFSRYRTTYNSNHALCKRMPWGWTDRYLRLDKESLALKYALYEIVQDEYWSASWDSWTRCLVPSCDFCPEMEDVWSSACVKCREASANRAEPFNACERCKISCGCYPPSNAPRGECPLCQRKLCKKCVHYYTSPPENKPHKICSICVMRMWAVARNRCGIRKAESAQAQAAREDTTNRNPAKPHEESEADAWGAPLEPGSEDEPETTD